MNRSELLLVLLEKGYVMLDAGPGKIFQPGIILVEAGGCAFGGVTLEVRVEILVYQLIVLCIESGSGCGC
jgi:hypothetical protein